MNTRQRDGARPGDLAARSRDPVAAGRVLLVAVGAVVTATAPLLALDRTGWITLLAISAVMMAVTGISFLVPWHRLPTATTVVFPLAVFAALSALGVATGGLTIPYAPVFTLAFAYTGLTHPARRSMWLLSPAAMAYVATVDEWSVAVGVRVAIATAVWALLALLLADLTGQQRALVAALRRSAHTDALTGVGNRRELDLRLDEPATTAGVVVLCDLDHFKALNDRLGHAAGDVVLTDFGLTLRAGLREGDYAARYGGEEFVLLLPDSTYATAGTVLARLRADWGARHPGVTFSAGLAAVDVGCLPALALRDADRALYAAKAGGRNQDGFAADVPAAPAEITPASERTARAPEPAGAASS